MTKLFEILKNSLIKKENEFSMKLQHHIDTVKQANGQPLNDKRNGMSALNKWEKQENALRNIQAGIEKTKNAIEIEEHKIKSTEISKSTLPDEILNLLNEGKLIQWRKHPNRFFVKGVDKARIVWDEKLKKILHVYVNQITDKEQYALFKEAFNALNQSIKQKTK